MAFIEPMHRNNPNIIYLLSDIPHENIAALVREIGKITNIGTTWLRIRRAYRVCQHVKSSVKTYVPAGISTQC